MPQPAPHKTKARALLGLVAALLILFAPAACRTEAGPEPLPQGAHDPSDQLWSEFFASADELKKTYGVSIRVDAEGDSFIPRGWTRRPIFGRAEAIDALEANRIVPVLRRFLDAYPKSVLRDDLKSIHLARRLIFYRRSYGGTNSAEAIYLSCRDESEGFDEDYLLGTLHAEFSSVLLRKHPRHFDIEAFDESLPAGFAYSGTGVEILHQSGLLAPDPALLRLGFLSRYATSSRENDFNAFARWIHVRPKALDALGEDQPQLARKAALVRRFYDALRISL